MHELPDVRNESFLLPDDAKLFARVVNYDGAGLQLVDYLTGHHLGSCILNVPSVWLCTLATVTLILDIILMGRHELEEVGQYKDLGVVFDQSLKFHSRVAKAIAKANMILNPYK